MPKSRAAFRWMSSSSRRRPNSDAPKPLSYRGWTVQTSTPQTLKTRSRPSRRRLRLQNRCSPGLSTARRRHLTFSR